MPKKKLKKFAENKTFRHLLEPTREELINGAFAWRGRWKEFFGNDHPIVLELGCGKGEYTVGLARNYPEKNFIGVDIKGARMWRGGKTVQENQIANAAFLRMQIEWVEFAFAPDEVDEIWITFPDPQIKYKRAKHRLTHPDFLDRYRKFLKKEGVVHLKSDSEFLHGYTHGVVQLMRLPVYAAYHDLDKQFQEPDPLLHGITTYYESIWRKMGKPITYLKFGLHAETGDE